MGVFDFIKDAGEKIFKPGEAKKEAADRGKTPKTLQGVPAAAPADDTDANPFAYLDRLSGEKLEAAVEKLSPEDRVRWAHSQ